MKKKLSQQILNIEQEQAIKSYPLLKNKTKQNYKPKNNKKGNSANDSSGNSPEGKKLMTSKGHWELSIEGVFCSY